MDAIARTYGLRPLGLADKPLFDAAFATLKRPVSEYSFANTFIWRTGEKLYWAPIEGHLCVFADGDDDLTMLYPPMGEGNLARGQYRFHVNAQVMGTIRRQLARYFGQLFAHAQGVAPLSMDKRARENDEALVKIAALLTPRVFQHFMAVPKLLSIKQFDKGREG